MKVETQKSSNSSALQGLPSTFPLSTLPLSILVLVGAIFFPQSLHAEINLKDAGLIRSWKDGGEATGVIRTYSSRSLYRGLFGFGWCSDIDRIFASADATGGKLRRKSASQAVVVDARGNTIQIQLVGSFVRQIRFARGASYQYEYRHEDLTAVYRNDRLLYRLSYNEFHNLNLIEYADGQREQYFYDDERDRLLAWLRPDGCREIYEYDNLNPYRPWSSATEDCQGRRRLLVRMEFFYRLNSKGQIFLQRVRSHVRRRQYDVFFHPKDGTPTIQLAREVLHEQTPK
ncbi:MAG: hypothetical protein C5B49_09240 [Bdellovibrio sp.]|nr:MAG: hypothetical protein C5B49_09240 [Bdellovibrio sp.]